MKNIRSFDFRTSPSRAVLSILLLVGFPLLDACSSSQAVVTLADGSEKSVRGWTFRYEFGASNTPVVGGALYELQSRTSDDLAMQGVPGIGELRIEGSDLKNMSLEWYGLSSPQPSLLMAELTMCDGRLLKLPDITPSHEFLTSKEYVVEPHVYLRGTDESSGVGVELPLDRLSGDARSDPGQRVTHVSFETNCQ